MSPSSLKKIAMNEIQINTILSSHVFFTIPVWNERHWNSRIKIMQHRPTTAIDRALSILFSGDFFIFSLGLRHIKTREFFSHTFSMSKLSEIYFCRVIGLSLRELLQVFGRVWLFNAQFLSHAGVSMLQEEKV